MRSSPVKHRFSALLILAVASFSGQMHADEFPLSARTTTPNLSARSGPGSDYPVTYQFKEQGSRLALFSYRDGWYKVSPSYSTPAWVHGDSVVRDSGLDYRLNKASGLYDYYFDVLAPSPPPPKGVAKEERRGTELPVSARVTSIDNLQFQDRVGRRIDWRPAGNLVEHIVVYEMTESQYRITPDVSYFAAWISREQVRLTPNRPLPLQHPHYDGNSVRTKRYALPYIKDLAQVRQEWVEDEVIQLRVQQAMEAHERSQVPFGERAANVLGFILLFLVPPAILVFTLVQSSSLSHHAVYYIGTGIAWAVLLVVLPASLQIPTLVLALALLGGYWLYMHSEWKYLTNYQSWKGAIVSDKPPEIIVPGQASVANEPVAVQRRPSQGLQQESPPVTKDNLVKAFVARLFGRHLSKGLKEVENYHQGQARVHDAMLDHAKAQNRWGDRKQILDVESDDREIVWRQSQRAVERERAIDRGEGADKTETHQHKPSYDPTDPWQFKNKLRRENPEEWAAMEAEEIREIEEEWAGDPKRAKREIALFKAAVAEHRAKLRRGGR